MVESIYLVKMKSYSKNLVTTFMKKKYTLTSLLAHKSLRY